jgi:hypothetical protein
LIPTSMVDSMNPVVALALAGQDTTSQKANGPLPVSPNTRKELTHGKSASPPLKRLAHERVMPLYRTYIIGRADHFWGAEDIDCMSKSFT